MNKTLNIKLSSAQQATEFAQLVARLFFEKNLFNQGFIFYLQGDLGVGKSHFSRAFIQHYLPNQKVKSPTYTIVESYNFSTKSIYHLDLYRLCDPEELEYLAIRDLFVKDYVALIEWPSKGKPVLPAADVELSWFYEELDQNVESTHLEAAEVSEAGRMLQIESHTAQGDTLLAALHNHF